MEFIGNIRPAFCLVATSNPRRAHLDGISGHICLVIEIHTQIMVHFNTCYIGLSFKHTMPSVKAGCRIFTPMKPQPESIFPVKW